MARNSAGIMSPPGSYPQANGDIISLEDYEAVVDDINGEITDSLSRSGKGAMQAPLRAVDGSAALPGVSFDAEQSTGLWRSGAAAVKMMIQGVQRMFWTGTGVVINGDHSVTGAHTVTGNVTTTGYTTMYSDANLVAGNLHLSQAGDQSIGKDTAGKLILGTSAGNNSEVQLIQNGNLVGSITTAGDLVMQSHKVSGLSAPSAGSSDAATAAYAEAKRDEAKAYTDTRLATAPSVVAAVTYTGGVYGFGFNKYAPGVSPATASKVGNACRITHASITGASHALAMTRGASTYALVFSFIPAAGYLDVYTFNSGGVANDSFQVAIWF